MNISDPLIYIIFSSFKWYHIHKYYKTKSGVSSVGSPCELPNASQATVQQGRCPTTVSEPWAVRAYKGEAISRVLGPLPSRVHSRALCLLPSLSHTFSLFFFSFFKQSIHEQDKGQGRMKKGELKKQQKRISEYVFYEASLTRAVTKYPHAKQNKPRGHLTYPQLVNRFCLEFALMVLLLRKMPFRLIRWTKIINSLA